MMWCRVQSTKWSGNGWTLFHLPSHLDFFHYYLFFPLCSLSVSVHHILLLFRFQAPFPTNPPRPHLQFVLFSWLLWHHYNLPLPFSITFSFHVILLARPPQAKLYLQTGMGQFNREFFSWVFLLMFGFHFIRNVTIYPMHVSPSCKAAMWFMVQRCEIPQRMGLIHDNYHLENNHCIVLCCNAIRSMHASLLHWQEDVWTFPVIVWWQIQQKI